MVQSNSEKNLDVLFENYNQAKAACFDAAADLNTPLEKVRELSQKYESAKNAFFEALPQVPFYTGPVIWLN